jgi:hypothetical protein
MFVAVALAMAIVKPWGGDLRVSVPGLTPPPLPSPSPSPSPQIGFSGLAYDPAIFGNHEPEATWGIWLAGYLVTFGFVVQVPGARSPSPDPSRAAGSEPIPTAAVPSGSSDPGPAASGSGGREVPIWPARFDVPEGDHILLIGINMPDGYSVASARLRRYPTLGALVTVGIERLKPPWPGHFAVIGIPTGTGDGRLDVWPPGRYRLDLIFDPGGISSSMEIQIASPAT